MSNEGYLTQQSIIEEMNHTFTLGCEVSWINSDHIIILAQQ